MPHNCHTRASSTTKKNIKLLSPPLLLLPPLLLPLLLRSLGRKIGNNFMSRVFLHCVCQRDRIHTLLLPWCLTLAHTHPDTDTSTHTHTSTLTLQHLAESKSLWKIWQFYDQRILNGEHELPENLRPAGMEREKKKVFGKCSSDNDDVDVDSSDDNGVDDDDDDE